MTEDDILTHVYLELGEAELKLGNARIMAEYLNTIAEDDRWQEALNHIKNAENLSLQADKILDVNRPA